MKYAIIVILFFSLYQIFAGEKETIQVQKKISEGITLLESDKTKEFLESFISPLDRGKGKLTIDDNFIEGFNIRKKDKLLKLLKIIKDSKPVISKEKLVSFKIKNGYLTFEYYRRKWYISNKSGKPKTD